MQTHKGKLDGPWNGELKPVDRSREIPGASMMEQ